MAFQLPRLLLPLLLVLAGAVDVMGESATSYHDDTCTPDTTITDQDGQEDIEWRRFKDTELLKRGYAFMNPDEGFKGLSLRVTLHSKTPSSTTPVQDTQEGFFPLNDTCFWGDAALWWVVDARVKVTPRSSNEHDGGQDLIFVLRVGQCGAKCVVQLQEESRLYTLQWTAYGPSRWRKNEPGGECMTRLPGGPLKEYNSCLKPPGTTATQDDTISIIMIIILSMLTGAVGVVGFFGLKIINTEIQQRSG